MKELTSVTFSDRELLKNPHSQHIAFARLSHFGLSFHHFNSVTGEDQHPYFANNSTKTQKDTGAPGAGTVSHSPAYPSAEQTTRHFLGY